MRYQHATAQDLIIFKQILNSVPSLQDHADNITYTVHISHIITIRSLTSVDLYLTDMNR